MNQCFLHVHIVTGGDSPAENQLLSHLSFLPLPSYIIAADSGLDTARRYGIIPNSILGDMDSVSSKELLSQYNKDKVTVWHADKDYTDTELAVIEAQKLVTGKKAVITMTGADGGRIDHLLAVRTLYDRNLAPDIWICKTQAVYYLSAAQNGAGVNAVSFIKISNLTSNDYISVFPVGIKSRGCASHLYAESESLQWPLQNVDWDSGQISISNKIDENTYDKNGSAVTLSAVCGSFIAVIPLSASVISYGNPSC